MHATRKKSLMLDAVKKNDIKAVRNLHTEYLIQATEKGLLEIVVKLIKEGEDVNTQDNDGNTILSIAAKKKNIDLVEWFLENGANVNASNKDGRTALVKACFVQNIDIIKKLIQKGANVNVQSGQYNSTPLIHASAVGCQVIAIELIKSGANVNIRDNKGNTALNMAVVKKHADIAEILLKLGANIDQENKLIRNVLDSTQEEDKKIKNLLLQHYPTFSLKYFARQNIVNHLISLGQPNTFVAIPKLDLPIPLQKYMMYSDIISS